VRAIPYGLYRPNRAQLPLLRANTTRGYAHFSNRQNLQCQLAALEDVPDILAHLP